MEIVLDLTKSPDQGNLSKLGDPLKSVEPKRTPVLGNLDLTAISLKIVQRNSPSEVNSTSLLFCKAIGRTALNLEYYLGRPSG